MKRKTILLMLAMFGVSAGLGAQNNPLIGTWKTNPAKSKLHLGASSENNLTTYEASGPNGIKYTSDRIGSDGQTEHIEYTANIDGKTYPYKLSGTNITRDEVAIRRTNANTFQIFYKLKGETVQINYWIVSPDGESLTTVSTGLNADGSVYSRMMVSDKQ